MSEITSFDVPATEGLNPEPPIVEPKPSGQAELVSSGKIKEWQK